MFKITTGETFVFVSYAPPERRIDFFDDLVWGLYSTLATIATPGLAQENAKRLKRVVVRRNALVKLGVRPGSTGNL